MTSIYLKIKLAVVPGFGVGPDFGGTWAEKGPRTKGRHDEGPKKEGPIGEGAGRGRWKGAR